MRSSSKAVPDKPSGYPEPPKILATITGAELRELLKPYGIDLKYPSDWKYGLPARSDYIWFLTWYKVHAPIKPSEYTDDARDCDDFAWVMKAYATLWMEGKCPFGYVEASSIDENYKYPMHAFCFMVDWNKKVYFVDPLEVAAPDDDTYPAYVVVGQDAKV